MGQAGPATPSNGYGVTTTAYIQTGPAGGIMTANIGELIATKDEP